MNYLCTEYAGMNVPNAITILRIMFVPLLAYLLLHGEYRAAIWVLLVAGLTDALDGLIARRFNLCTDLGAVLDPLADKLLIITSVLALAWVRLLPGWLAIVIVARDMIIIGGATAYYLRAGQLHMNPSLPSKLNTFVQICMVLLILGRAAGMVKAASWLPVLFGCALFTTIFSGIHYIVIWGQKGAALKKKAASG
jgi:cardiolipin synthase